MSIVDNEILKRLMKKRPPKEKKYIIAGNYHEFLNWCWENDYQPRVEAIFVIGLDRIRGLDSNARFEFIGTWAQRSDAGDILEYVTFLVRLIK
jgi:hypothetical protein